ncbi:hypothetical protein BKA69DRAFT_1128745 [Paraphysoderma sedebokerense]|nr:hypothetical protein BKA69DRAFT_1128745 [Paraphysoderma sedebokerense]
MPAQRNRHQNAKAPRLPSALVSEMETELGKPGNRSRKRKSRKEERKEKRMAKKQKVHHHFSRKNNATEGKVKLASLPKSSKQNGPTSGNTATISIKKPATNNEVSGSDKQRLEKLAKNNPNFYQMLVEDQLVNPADSVSSSRSDQDDMDIRRYEKKLGLKRKAKKSTKKLSSGIGELLSTLESDFGLVCIADFK